MVESMAALSMSMKSTEFQQAYSVAVIGKVMESYEQVAQTSIKMMAESTARIPAKGQYIDVYA